MKRILGLLLAVVAVVALLMQPVSAAETITDLKKVHTNLTQYLYTPYYEKSQYFEEYQSVMNEVGELLQSDDITQAEISKYYNKIKEVYSLMMRDTYDYSSLQVILDSYDALDSSIFTEESWKKVLSIHDSILKELDSPSLFPRSDNTSETQYTAYINSHIRNFTTEFNTAFNRLVFIEVPEQMTPEFLNGITKLVRFCSRSELLANAKDWNKLLEAMDDAEKLVKSIDEGEEIDDEVQTELNETYENLLTTYYNVCNESYDFSASKDALSKYHVLNEKSFSKASWDRYSEKAVALEKRLQQPHFFFIPFGADKATCEKYANAYLSALPTSTVKEQGTLIPVESEQKLKSLCNKYRTRTTLEGLDIKLNLLKTLVAEGDAVLANKDATLDDVNTAIQNIENANNDLIRAEGHLKEEQGKVLKQDAKTSRYTIIFYIASLILATGLAMYLSRIHHGKVNWSK